jgi:LmbE family N-acetylglucosaminyl deacetylase
MSLLDAIAAPGDIDASRVLIVTAHPDDETLAFGTLMRRLGGVRIVLATDGSPRDMLSQQRLGFDSVGAYRDARHAELIAALAVAGLAPAQLIRLEFPDKQLAGNLTPFAAALRRLFDERQIEAVLTHAYEGGHPDHDAVAAAVTLATRGSAIEVVEAPFYRSRNGRFAVQSFTPIEGIPIVETPLTPQEAAHKLGMVACYPSQAGLLDGFQPRVERFRHMPAHDFTQPPNGGEVDYEKTFFPWTDWAKATAHAFEAA